MLTIVPREQRKIIGAESTGSLITGLLTEKTAGTRQPCLFRNISDAGVDLWTDMHLPPHTKVNIALGNEYGGLSIECEVNSSADDSAGGYNSRLKFLATV
jgi:hypothetical protein